MATYTVAHACGHDHDYQLVGKHADRDRKIKWLEKQACQACAKKDAGPVAYVRIVGGVFPLVDIAVVNSYVIREPLKAHGYEFRREACVLSDSHDLLTQMMARPQPGWCCTIEGDRQYVADQLEVELTWLQEQEIPCKIVDGLAAMVAAVVEGRPDFVGVGPTHDPNPTTVRFGPMVSRLLGYDPSPEQPK